MKNIENTHEPMHLKTHWLDLLLVAVICAAFFGYRLGSYVPLTDHEGFVSVTAKEALAGDWVVPHFNDQIRLQKTPLMYWVVAAIGGCFGKVDEFTTRLPSAISASGIALLLTWWVGRMFGRLTGVITGLSTVSTVGMLWMSHVGIADMMMTFFVTATFVFLYLGLERIQMGKPCLWAMIGAYISFSLGMMAKGPVPLPVVLLPIFCFLVWAGLAPRWELASKSGIVGVVKAGFKGLWSYVGKMHILMGILIFVVIVGSWAVAILLKVPNAQYRWYEEYVARCIGDFGTSRPFYYYIPQIFLLTLPWSVFLPVGLVLPFKKFLKERQFELMFIFLWLVVDFIFFSAVAGKRAHYILPIVPPAIVLSVLGMVYALEHWLSRRFVSIASLVVILATLIALIIGNGYIQEHHPEVIKFYRLICVVLIFAEAVAFVAYLRVHILVSVTVMSLAAGFIFALVWPMVPQFSEASHDPRVAAKLIKEAVGPDATIYSIGRAHPPLVYYYGRFMPQIPSDQEIVTIFKTDKTDIAIAKLQDTIAEKIMDMVRRPECVYFAMSSDRYLIAQVYAKQHQVKLYEVLQIPGFYSDNKDFVLVSNCPKPTTAATK
jgi:4-amino-4-deoxy-L-arabinose transferase-like glycosyltransferase